MRTSLPLTKLGAALLLSAHFAMTAHAEQGFTISTVTNNRSTASDLFVKPDSRILPISASFETERFIYTGTVSYLQLSGLRGIPRYDYRWVKTAASDYGTPLADFVAQEVDTSLTYKVPQVLPGGLQLDLTGGIKFQNGELLNSSTMLKSYSVQLAFTREFGKLTAETGVGYRLRDNPEATIFQNSASAYVGGSYQLGIHSKFEMYADIRQGARLGAANEAEVTAYFTHELPRKNLTLQSYVFKGASQANRDLETGLMLKMSF
jgi:hypothetical protein